MEDEGLGGTVGLFAAWSPWRWWHEAAPDVPQTSLFHDLPDNCLEEVAQLLVSSETSEHITNLALTCRKLKSVADHVMEQEQNKPPILRIEYSTKRIHSRLRTNIVLVVSKNHWMYQNLGSIKHLFASNSVVGDEKKMRFRRSLFEPEVDAEACRLISQAIPSIKTINARVDTEKDINKISSILGNVAVDTFNVDTSHFDEELKNAVLRFYENRKGRLLDINSNLLLHINNFELSVSLLLNRVDVTFRLRCIVNGISRPRWYGIFHSIIRQGGRVVVDDSDYPNELLERYREHVVRFSLPNRSP